MIGPAGREGALRDPPGAAMSLSPPLGSPREETAVTEDLIRGLEGVLAAETAICDLDGAGGRLAYCGYDVPEMVGRGVT